MKIALLGYGKMGQVIERIARKEVMKLFWKDENNTYEGLSTADVAIDLAFLQQQYQYLKLFSC
jgi:4-hydroxy-tetrahydrodipicolinate reductase